MSHWAKSSQAEWDRREAIAEREKMEAEIEQLTTALREIYEESDTGKPNISQFSFFTMLQKCNALAAKALKELP